MTLGNIIDFIHSNCYPSDGYIQVLKEQKIRVILDSTCSDNNYIDIVKKDGVWTVSLNIGVGTIASNLTEIDMAISDFHLARSTFVKITTYLNFDSETGDFSIPPSFLIKNDYLGSMRDRKLSSESYPIYRFMHPIDES